MKQQMLAIAMVGMLVVGQPAWTAAQDAVGDSGVIQGTLSGDGGGIGGATINIVNGEGRAVRTGMTGAGGQFRFTNLVMGRYFVQAVSASGAVLSTKIATLTTENTVADVGMVALTPATNGGGAASAAGAGTLRTAAISAGISAAATAVGVVAIVGTEDDASPSR